MVEPMHIEDHWPRIAAIDFGWDHPTAVVWCAIDEKRKCSIFTIVIEHLRLHQQFTPRLSGQDLISFL